MVLINSYNPFFFVTNFVAWFFSFLFVQQVSHLHVLNLVITKCRTIDWTDILWFGTMALIYNKENHCHPEKFKYSFEAVLREGNLEFNWVNCTVQLSFRGRYQELRNNVQIPWEKSGLVFVCKCHTIYCWNLVLFRKKNCINSRTILFPS